jgi:two-component system, cell cycle response regulator DivK
MPGEHVLVVDDNAINLKLTRAVLVSEGFVVETLTGGHDLRAVLRRFQPRVVVMDLQLPETDGFELTRQIKGDPATATIGVVALTALAMPADAQRARAAGCDAFVTKPVDTRALGAVVRELLAHHP